MTFEDIIKQAIPDADEALCEYILWGRTCFPAGTITAKSLYKAAARWRRANINFIQLCDFCDRPALAGEFECKHHRGTYNQVANGDSSLLAKELIENAKQIREGQFGTGSNR